MTDLTIISALKTNLKLKSQFDLPNPQFEAISYPSNPFHTKMCHEFVYKYEV